MLGAALFAIGTVLRAREWAPAVAGCGAVLMAGFMLVQDWDTSVYHLQEDDRLTAARLQTFSLGRCGTLILGACESGSQHAGAR